LDKFEVGDVVRVKDPRPFSKAVKKGDLMEIVEPNDKRIPSVEHFMVEETMKKARYPKSDVIVLLWINTIEAKTVTQIISRGVARNYIGIFSKASENGSGWDNSSLAQKIREAKLKKEKRMKKQIK